MKKPKDIRLIFDWAENSVQESLKQLRKGETEYDGKQKIGEIMDEIANSHLFWTLFAKYETAHQECEGNTAKQTDHILALVARMYIAGSFLPRPVIDPA